MEDLRVAAVQMCSPVGEIQKNLQKMRQYILQAQTQKVDLICFPEMNIPGYWASPDQYDLAQPIPGEITDEVVKMAEESGITILAGMAEKAPSGVIYNTQIVATPDGLAGKYRKLHVNQDEISFFSYGSELPVFPNPKVTFGIEICYDSHFPELSTSLALMGCEVLFFPHASGNGTGFDPQEWERREEKIERWLRYLPARAYDNSVFVVVCNQIGENGAGNSFPGICLILDPKGRIIAEAKTSDEEMILAELKAADLVSVRKHMRSHFFLHYRRPELYGALVKGQID
jgi:N-carbamoylputrescine amidase